MVELGQVSEPLLCLLTLDGVTQGTDEQIPVAHPLYQIILRASLHSLYRQRLVIQST